MTSNTIPTFQDGEKYLECILQKGDHDFVSTDSPKQISKTIFSISVICLDCGFTDTKYSILQEEDSYDI